MATYISDSFAGLADAAALNGRTLNNALGGGASGTWVSGGSNFIGNGGRLSFADVGARAGVNIAAASGIIKTRVLYDPNGTADNNLFLFGENANDDGAGSSAVCFALGLFGGLTSLRVCSLSGGSRTDHATLGITAPAVAFYIELELNETTKVVTARVLNADTSVRNTVSHTFTTVPTSGGVWGIAGYFGTLNGFYDDFLVDVSGGGDTTAPTLTSATGTATGSTTATGTVSTDEANGTLYYVTTVNATETAATVKAGLSQAVTATGVQNVSRTGLTASTTYRHHFVHRDAAGNDSAVLTSGTFTTTTPDVTAPTLSSGVGTVKSNALIVVGATTNEANGTMYVVVTTSATPPSAAQVKLGQNNAGTAAVFAANQAISSTGAKTFNATGLTQLTGYYPYIVHTDAAGNDSDVLSIGLRTTFRNGATGQFITDNTGPVGGNPSGLIFEIPGVGEEDDWFSYYVTVEPATGVWTRNPDGTFTYVGPNTETAFVQYEKNGVAIGEPQPITLYDVTLSIFRPASDVISTGWVSTEATLAGAIDEVVADDAGYITSPALGLSPGPYTFNLTASIAAGEKTVRIRYRRTGGTGQVRVVFLDAVGTPVGSTAWQVAAAAFATIETGVTLSATAIRARIEVQS